jgi:hypothetical protein
MPHAIARVLDAIGWAPTTDGRLHVHEPDVYNSLSLVHYATMLADMLYGDMPTLAGATNPWPG